MAFVVFLNELSFPSGRLNVHDPVSIVVGLVQTLRTLKAVHADIALHSSVLIPNIPLGEGAWLGPVMSAGEARDDWRYLRSVQNRSPFTADLVNPVGGETEYQFSGVTAVGLGLSHAMGALAISLPIDGWLQSTIEIQRLHLGTTGKIDEETVSVFHVASPEHVATNEEWIRSTGITNVLNGDDMWDRREELFPHLKFLPRVEAQLHTLKAGDVLLASAGTALMDLELALSTWNRTDEKYPAFRTKVSQEGETRSRLCRWKDLEGVERDFDLHSRYTPGAGRVHFWCDRRDGTATIGHVGEKIPD